MRGPSGDFEIHHAGVGRSAFGRYLTRQLPLNCPDALWVNAGFCGGLRPELGVGSIVTEEVSPQVETQLRRFVTVEKVLGTAEEKSRLAGANPEAWAVEMESAIFAEFCQTHGLRGVVIRAVSDTLAEDFPLPEGVLYDLERQSSRPAALAGYLLSHPGKIFPFLRFLRGLKRAQRELGRALIDFFAAEGSLEQR